jgi:SAM-dependent methyltransferase
MSISKQKIINQFTSSIKLNDNGIYYADSKEAVSYPDDGNDECFEIEENSFWFQHRNNCIIEMIKNYPPVNNGLIFDIGGGNGFVSRGLLNAGFNVVLVEPGPSGVKNAKRRGLPHVICATTHTAKFKSETIPAIGVFDVVEHIDDDIGFLNDLWELLVPGGLLYLTVPAYQSLWSQEDVEGGHFRRYTLRNLRKKLNETGFSVKYSTYVFIFLPLCIFFLRTVPYRLKLSNKLRNYKDNKRDHSTRKGIVGRILDKIMHWEFQNIKFKKTFFIGGSCMVTAQKI